MSKHIVERDAPKECRVPDNIPEAPKFKCIVADPPWSHSQLGKYGSINHYDLMSLERIKNMPINDLAAEDCYLWLWTPNGLIPEALEVMKTWGFRYQTEFTWLKANKFGLGRVLRNCTETLLVGIKGHPELKCRNQINWGIFPVGIHSEKPREMTSIIERVSDGPYLELFCRKRPASNQKWHCWGDQTEGGADIYIPGYPVPKYSFENQKEPEDGATSSERDITEQKDSQDDAKEAV